MVAMLIVVGLLAVLISAAGYDTLRRRKVLEATLPPGAGRAQYRADHGYLHGGSNGGF